MAITTTITPPALSLSRNQMPLRLDAGDAFTQDARASVYQHTWGAPDVDGDTVQFEWAYDGTTYDITFTFKTTPVAADFDIARYTGASTAAFQAWIEGTLIPGLLAHPDFNEFFNAQLYTNGANNGLRIIARDPYFFALNLDQTPTGFTITEASADEGTGQVAAINYAARYWVSIAPTATSTFNSYLRLPEMQAYPDEEGNIDIDIQQIIAPYFRDTELPALPPTAAFSLLTTAPRKVYVEYGQQSGDPLVRGPISRTAEIRVLPGGVHTHDWPGIRTALPNYFLNSDEWRFLTNRKKQVIYKGTPQFLHWYQAASLPAEPLRLILEKYTASGTTKQPAITDTVPVSATFRVMRVPVYPEIFAAGATSNATHFSAHLGTQVDALFTRYSEIINFEMRPRPTGLTTILYQNAWGMPETISLPWTRERIATVGKQMYERTRPLNYTAKDSPIETYAEQMVERFEIGIDQADPVDAPHLAELMLAPQAWLMLGDDTLIPIRIMGGKMNMELQGRQGQFSPTPALIIEMDRQVSFSRIINLTDLCT